MVIMRQNGCFNQNYSNLERVLYSVFFIAFALIFFWTIVGPFFCLYGLLDLWKTKSIGAFPLTPTTVHLGSRSKFSYPALARRSPIPIFFISARKMVVKAACITFIAGWTTHGSHQ